MEDQWWCGTGSRAGSGGVAGRLKALGFGVYDNRRSWPGVDAAELPDADMERVADLLDLDDPEERKRVLGAIQAFKVTYLAKFPGRAAYTTNHASRPAWFSRTRPASAWTLINQSPRISTQARRAGTASP